MPEGPWPDIALAPGIDGLSAAFLIVASWFTSAVTAAFGIGGGLMMLSLMATFIAPPALIPLHGLVQLGSNAGRAWHLRRQIAPRRLAGFALGAVAGALVGAFFVVALPSRLLLAVLGVSVIVLVWAKLPAPALLNRGGIAVNGFVTTLGSMFVGATGPLVLAFSARIFADRHALVANHAAAMTIQHTLKTAAIVAVGVTILPWLPLIGCMLVSGYVGTLTGARLLSAIPEERFRVALKVILTVLALNMLRMAVMM